MRGEGPWATHIPMAQERDYRRPPLKTREEEIRERDRGGAARPQKKKGRDRKKRGRRDG